MKSKKHDKMKTDLNQVILFCSVLVLFLLLVPFLSRLFNQVEHERKMDIIQEQYETDKNRVEIYKSMIPMNVDDCTKGCNMAAKKIMESEFAMGDFDSHKCLEYCLKGE